VFKGGLQDRATGLVKFWVTLAQRHHRAWTQQDTLDAPFDPANANRYAFAGGDPINNADPTGLDINNDIVGGLVGVIVGAACAASTAGAGAIACGVLGLAVGLAYTYAANYLEYGETPTLGG
jgi:RHS repeat-associated protein